MRSSLKIALSITFVTCSLPSFALYRCGNSFQDTPCTSGSTSSSARPSVAATSNSEPASSSASQKTSAFAAVCGRWGKSALDVAWKREAGALRESQLAKSSGDLNSKDYATVVDSVYAKRGAAPSIRVAVEAECVAQKQQEADEAAALAALSRKFGTADKNAGTEVSQGESQMKSTSSEDNAKNRKTADKKALCADLNEQLIDVKNSARRGVKIGTMEKLNSETREIERKISNAKC
jgi:hypothetical protein